MTAKDKAALMRRLRLQRQREGFVQVNVWAHRDDAAKVRQYAAKLAKRRADHVPGSRDGTG